MNIENYNDNRGNYSPLVEHSARFSSRSSWYDGLNSPLSYTCPRIGRRICIGGMGVELEQKNHRVNFLDRGG
jgi:hypothetical protein